MAKRFTATEKWSDPWHRKLPPEYKLFWDYLCGSCNNAGIWSVDFERAEFEMGVRIGGEKALELFGPRIRVLNPQYWFVKDFISFQYGELSPASRPHSQVLALLKKHGVSKGYPKGIHTLEDKDKDKDKDSSAVDVRDGVEGISFDEIWKQYPRRLGRKQAERHFTSTVKTTEDFAKIKVALNHYLASRQVQDGYIQHGSTWFNNWQDWIDFQEESTNGPHGGPSPISYAALARAKRETEKARKVATPRALSARGRDLPSVQTEALAGVGVGRRGAEEPLDQLRKENSLESQPDGGDSS